MKKFIDFLENKANRILLIAIVIIIYLLLRQNSSLANLKEDFAKNLSYFKDQQTSEREDLKKQLALLREELIRYKSQQEGRDQILGLTLTKNQTPEKNAQPTEDNFNNLIQQTDQLMATISAQTKIKGIVKLKNNWEKSDIYQSPKPSAMIIGTIVKDKLYFVYEIVGNWLKIEYQEGKFGYIPSNLVDQL
jgi:hypothetical protein